MRSPQWTPGTPRKRVATQCGWSFLVLLLRCAARDGDDDTRLRTIAVEPVVGNHAPEDDDAGPENQRENAGQACPLWNRRRYVPLAHAAIDRRVKNPRVETCADEQHHLHPKPDALIRPHRNRVEE